MSEPRDIVERLRADRGAGRTHWADCEEAAREIEALRAALQTLSNGVLGSLPLMEPLARQEMGNTNYGLLIERAEKALALCAPPAPGFSPSAVKSEVERLRAAVVELNGHLDDYWNGDRSDVTVKAICAAQAKCRAALSQDGSAER